MKIAIVWNHPSRLLDCSFRFERYLEGFRALGHEPILVCHEGNEIGFPASTTTFPADAFPEPETWQRLGAEVVVIVTWHRMANVLEAMQDAGLAVIAISDSDGQVGVRVHPRQTFERLWVYHQGLRAKLKCTKFWLRHYLGDGRGENEEYIASTAASDVLIVGSRVGSDNFRRFLRRRHRDDLESRLAWAPFQIGASFLDCPLPATKADRLVAVGRWADPQKNAPLLVAAFERVLERRSDTELLILGSGGARTFADLCSRHPQVEYRGEVDQIGVAQALAGARSIVFSSRWEGSPHAANEALATGATIIGPALPSLVSWSEDGRFGRIAHGSSPADLARAITTEMEVWDRGERDHHAIADEWRRRLAPETICGELLIALEAVGRSPVEAPHAKKDPDGTLRGR